MHSKPATTEKVTAGSETLYVASNNAGMSFRHRNSFHDSPCLKLTSSTGNRRNNFCKYPFAIYLSKNNIVQQTIIVPSE